MMTRWMYRPAGLFHKQRNMAIEHDGRTSWGGHIIRSSYLASKPLHTILLASEIRQHPVFWEHHIWDKPNNSGYMPLQPGIAIHSLLLFILVDLAIGHVCCKGTYAARPRENLKAQYMNLHMVGSNNEHGHLVMLIISVFASLTVD